MRSWICAAAVISLTVVPLVVGSGAGAGRTATVIFPPWWTSGHAFSAAAAVARPMGTGTVPFAVVVGADLDPAFAARLRDQGAWLVLPALGAFGCETTFP